MVDIKIIKVVLPKDLKCSRKNISVVQASLGHTSSQMTERYAKVIALLDRGVAEKTAKVFDIFGSKNKISK